MSWKADTTPGPKLLKNVGAVLRADSRCTFERDLVGPGAKDSFSSQTSFRTLVATGLVLIAVVLLPRQVSALEVGSTFPPFAGYRFDGALPQDLAGKILVVDFWASWCGPCKASFPSLSAVQNEFATRGVVILGISVDEKSAAYEQFKKRMQPTFATVRDGEHRLTADVSVPTMPTTFVVDRTGRVRFVHAGFHDTTPDALRRELAQLLEEKS